MKHNSDHIKLPQVIPAFMSSLERNYLDKVLQIEEQVANSEGSLYEFLGNFFKL